MFGRLDAGRELFTRPPESSVWGGSGSEPWNTQQTEEWSVAGGGSNSQVLTQEFSQRLLQSVPPRPICSTVPPSTVGQNQGSGCMGMGVGRSGAGVGVTIGVGGTQTTAPTTMGTQNLQPQVRPPAASTPDLRDLTLARDIRFGLHTILTVMRDVPEQLREIGREVGECIREPEKTRKLITDTSQAITSLMSTLNEENTQREQQLNKVMEELVEMKKKDEEIGVKVDDAVKDVKRELRREVRKMREEADNSKLQEVVGKLQTEVTELSQSLSGQVEELRDFVQRPRTPPPPPPTQPPPTPDNRLATTLSLIHTTLENRMDQMESNLKELTGKIVDMPKKLAAEMSQVMREVLQQNLCNNRGNISSTFVSPSQPSSLLSHRPLLPLHEIQHLVSPVAQVSPIAQVSPRVSQAPPITHSMESSVSGNPTHRATMPGPATLPYGSHQQPSPVIRPVFYSGRSYTRIQNIQKPATRISVPKSSSNGPTLRNTSANNIQTSPKSPSTQFSVTRASIPQSSVARAPVTQNSGSRALIPQSSVARVPVTQSSISRASGTQSSLSRAPVTQSSVSRAPVTQSVSRAQATSSHSFLKPQVPCSQPPRSSTIAYNTRSSSRALYASSVPADSPTMSPPQPPAPDTSTNPSAIMYRMQAQHSQKGTEHRENVGDDIFGTPVVVEGGTEHFTPSLLAEDNGYDSSSSEESAVVVLPKDVLGNTSQEQSSQQSVQVTKSIPNYQYHTQNEDTSTIRRGSGAGRGRGKGRSKGESRVTSQTAMKFPATSVAYSHPPITPVRATVTGTSSRPIASTPIRNVSTQQTTTSNFIVIQSPQVGSVPFSFASSGNRPTLPTISGGRIINQDIQRTTMRMLTRGGRGAPKVISAEQIRNQSRQQVPSSNVMTTPVQPPRTDPSAHTPVVSSTDTTPIKRKPEEWDEDSSASTKNVVRVRRYLTPMAYRRLTLIFPKSSKRVCV